jgi:hypothetical protein
MVPRYTPNMRLIARGEVKPLPTNLPQLSTYVDPHIKEELTEMAEHHRRLSLSLLVSEAIDIAMPTLRARYGVFTHPVQVSPRPRKKRTA